MCTCGCGSAFIIQEPCKIVICTVDGGIFGGKFYTTFCIVKKFEDGGHFNREIILFLV